MSQFEDRSPSRLPGVFGSKAWGSKVFASWTVISALLVWLSLSILEGLAAERCHNDGLAWNWKAWACAHPAGTIILPSGLRRAGSD